MGTSNQIPNQLDPVALAKAAAQPVDPFIALAQAALSAPPFEYNDVQIATAIKKYSAAYLVTPRGKLQLLLDEYAGIVPYQWIARVEKWADAELPKNA